MSRLLFSMTLVLATNVRHMSKPDVTSFALVAATFKIRLVVDIDEIVLMDLFSGFR